MISTKRLSAPAPAKVIIYPSFKGQVGAAAAPVAASSSSAFASPQILKILEELIRWKKRVNARLRKLDQEHAIKQVLKEMVLPLLRQAQSAAALAPVSAAPPAASPAPEMTLGVPSLKVRILPSRQSTAYTLPDRTAGRIVATYPANSTVQLYEPFLENENGVWMKTRDQGWLQLYDRSTDTFFADV